MLPEPQGREVGVVSVYRMACAIEERYCRGDWAAPKTPDSAATIGVEPQVIARIQRLKILTVDVRAGRALKADGPDDLVFQSVKDGKPMSDGNILKRYIKPAARRLGLPFMNWRCGRVGPKLVGVASVRAMLAHIARYLVGASWRGSKVRTRPDAAFTYLLRADCSPGAAGRAQEAIAVRERVCPKFCPIIGPINGC